METAVATLLLVTASVVIACIVVSYAINTVEQTLNAQNIPQLDHLRSIENNILNQTQQMQDQYLNGTLTQTPDQPSP